MEVGLSLLAQSKLNTHFWVDAFQTAIYLINRLPSNICLLFPNYFKENQIIPS
jgi:hypothetical protein